LAEIVKSSKDTENYASERLSWQEVLCVRHETVNGHTHIGALGVRTLGGIIGLLPVKTVLEELESNRYGFFTTGSHSGQAAELTSFRCGCGEMQVRTEPDDEKDNNLDQLDECAGECGEATLGKAN
jgi:Protein of unknown function (DUF3892)